MTESALADFADQRVRNKQRAATIVSITTEPRVGADDGEQVREMATETIRQLAQSIIDNSN